MSFFTNPAQQMTLDDATFHLTARVVLEYK